MDDLDDDDKLDFSALDPARDERRWQRTLEATVARAQASRRVPPLVRELAALRRPALLLAAAAALLVWSASLVTPRRAPSTDRTTRDEASALLDWATSDETPTSGEILETLGGGHGDR